MVGSRRRRSREDQQEEAEEEAAGGWAEPLGAMPEPVGEVFCAVEDADERDADERGEQAERRHRAGIQW